MVSSGVTDITLCPSNIKPNKKRSLANTFLVCPEDLDYWNWTALSVYSSELCL